MRIHAQTRAELRGNIALLLACISLAVIAFTTTRKAAAEEDKKDSTFSQRLPEMDGKHLKITLVAVNYGPGEEDPPHSHPCAVIGHVARGTIRSQVQGEAERIYHQG